MPNDSPLIGDSLSENPPKTLAEEADRLARNKAVVLAFFDVCFVQKRLDEGMELYVDDIYIQHSANVASGKAAAIEHFRKILPTITHPKVDAKRVIAEGDLVVVHSHQTRHPDDPGKAVVDIFRVHDGKIFEHWDVMQDVPAASKNSNTLF